MFALCLEQNQHNNNNNTNNNYYVSMWMIIADRFECIKLKKKCQNLSTVNWTFLIILEIIQYAIFTKLIAINDTEVLHVKGKEFLSTMTIHRCWELVEFLSREERRVTQNFVGISITH